MSEERDHAAIQQRKFLSSTLTHLWWIEYDGLGRNFIFDMVEAMLRAIGEELPNAEHGGRKPKWGEQEPTTYTGKPK